MRRNSRNLTIGRKNYYNWIDFPGITLFLRVLCFQILSYNYMIIMIYYDIYCYIIHMTTIQAVCKYLASQSTERRVLPLGRLLHDQEWILLLPMLLRWRWYQLSMRYTGLYRCCCWDADGTWLAGIYSALATTDAGIDWSPHLKGRVAGKLHHGRILPGCFF